MAGWKGKKTKHVLRGYGENDHSIKDETKQQLKAIGNLIKGLSIRSDILKAQQECKRRLSEICELLGKEKYSQELKAMFEKWRNFYVDRGKSLPPQFYPIAIEYANTCVDQGNLKLAQEIVLSSASIVKSEDKINKVSQAEEEGYTILRDAILRISALIIQENEEELPQVVDTISEKLGRETQFDLFLKLAREIDIEGLKGEILIPSNITVDHNNLKTSTSSKNSLPHYLLPVPRFKFIIHEAFEGRRIKVYQGINSFDDYLIFEIEGLDIVVVEKFFEKDKEKGHKIAEGRDATFLVPKELIMELHKLSKKDLQEFRKVDPRIKKINHRSGTIKVLNDNEEDVDYDAVYYYRTFKTRFNGAIGYEFFENFGLDDPNINQGDIRGRKTIPGRLTRVQGKMPKDNIPGKANPVIEDRTTLIEGNKVDDREALIRQLEEKIKLVNRYTNMLKEAIAKKENTKEIERKLRSAREEMNKLNQQIR